MTETGPDPEPLIPSPVLFFRFLISTFFGVYNCKAAVVERVWVSEYVQGPPFQPVCGHTSDPFILACSRPLEFQKGPCLGTDTPVSPKARHWEEAFLSLHLLSIEYQLNWGVHPLLLFLPDQLGSPRTQSKAPSGRFATALAVSKEGGKGSGGPAPLRA